MKELRLKGLKGKNGMEIAPAIYKEIIFVTENIAICEDRHDKWGIISNSGLITLPFEYDKILRSSDNYIVCFKDDKAAIVVAKDILASKIITEFKYDSIKHISNDFDGKNAHFYLTVINDLYGFIYIENDKVIAEIEPIYSSFDSFKKGYIIVKKEVPDKIRSKRFKEGLVSDHAIEIIPPLYDDVGYFSKDDAFFSHGFARVKNDNKYSLINKDGTVFKSEYISLKYFPVSIISKPLFKVRNEIGCGIVDGFINVLIKPIYVDIGFDGNFFYCKRKDGFFDFYDTMFFKFNPTHNDELKFIGMVQDENYCVLITGENKIISNYNGDCLEFYDFVSEPKTIYGTRYVKKDNSYFLINENAKIVGKFDEFIEPVIIGKRFVAHYVRISHDYVIMNNEGKYLYL